MKVLDTATGDRDESWVKRIVVAADGSSASVLGLEQAASIAQRNGAAVVVVHVRHLPAAAVMAPGIDGQPVLDALDQLESEVRRQAIRILGGTDVGWEFTVRGGSPGEEIVKVVDEAAADLVVVGSNRHSSLHNLLLGSTAAYLTAHSPVPVFVSRSPAVSGAVPLLAIPTSPSVPMAPIPPSHRPDTTVGDDRVEPAGERPAPASRFPRRTPLEVKQS